MRVGISLTSSHAVDDPRDGARRMIEGVRTAAAAGLDTFTLGDHHVNAVPYYQNVPALARCLPEWGDRPYGCLFLLPLWNPVLVAEQVGTLAALGPGRFILQTGLGDGAEQFAGMGADLRGRAARLDESIRVIRALLEGETVSSERFGIVGATVAPCPPEPVEWWIGAHADAALDRAAREGDAWYASPTLTPVTAAERLARYRDACATHDRTPTRIIVRKDVLIGADGPAAERLGAEVLAAGYRGMRRDQVVIGTPEEAAEQLAPFAELGFTDVVVRAMAVPHEVALETINLAGEVQHLLR